MKKALITGITGQDGSYLAELLLDKQYEVHGVVRRVAASIADHRFWRIRHILDRIQIHAATLESYASLIRVISRVQPDECYHLAAQSFIATSFEDEFSTINSNLCGSHAMLAAVAETAPQCRFYFAASSEMFGKVLESPQSESSPFYPRSTYGVSKAAGYHLTRHYREAHGLFAVSGILFNHESPRRGYEFVSRKITSNVAKIKSGISGELRLGNLEARRDWGHARDYVLAMWMMLQQQDPEDFVIATGVSHTVRDLARYAFSAVDLQYEDHVIVDAGLYRPTEVDSLLGDASKAARQLAWKPVIGFEKMIQEMVFADLDALASGNKVHHFYHSSSAPGGTFEGSPTTTTPKRQRRAQ